jgi:hypothetical protein
VEKLELTLTAASPASFTGAAAAVAPDPPTSSRNVLPPVRLVAKVSVALPVLASYVTPAGTHGAPTSLPLASTSITR